MQFHADTDLYFDTLENFIDTCGSDTPHDDVLIFADPYDITDHFQDGYYIFPLSRFFGMWQEGALSLIHI